MTQENASIRLNEVMTIIQDLKAEFNKEMETLKIT